MADDHDQETLDAEIRYGSYAIGSFPREFGLAGEVEDNLKGIEDNDLPRILLMGLRRSGKSSIQKVVFHKMAPNETLFLESTNKIVKDDLSSSSFIKFQDDYSEALNRLNTTVIKAHKVNPDIKFEVFIHKVDGLSDDHKIEVQRDIHQRATGDMEDASLESIHLSFYLTSIYDHSIFEAFSKVVQKLIKHLGTLENLLNIFNSNSGIEKSFLFDVCSKIYIATDSSPVDMITYELCCDMLDVVIDVSCIYGLQEDREGSVYDQRSTSIIQLNNSTVLYLKEVNRFIALVAILRENSYEKRGLIDYNFHCLRKALQQVLELDKRNHLNSNDSSASVGENINDRTGNSVIA
ncbi:uncharacterized protein TRIADDRAFT_61123 [Trichoplax adhaerens]|uniref:Ras-related GTP-binding protein C n=1 Tax=Trichoplax adhaerens TaxID=10228 RepID=B3SA38_TRIAD|nr:hypothetical protein TRIADDRAFT_61123 [Trichoplax adhaerens]EDV20365.1 hypothetical protein TRIADDRAFT_61123 [Trichoplax adhaerens]|eukprot:XP_002117059.1 hypothetical protein TRIADDRAFT_61123 [Trichoplax adhaerens]